MVELGPIGFLNPWFALAFLVLPIIWWLLRATPPRPRREAFPGVRILIDLDNEERTPKRTPWWLLLLRLLAAAILIGAFLEPLLNPKAREPGEGPLLVILDGGWTSAADWEARIVAARDLLDQARQADRPAALARLAEAGPPPESLTFEPADVVAQRLDALEPSAWRPDPSRLTAALDASLPDLETLETVWFRDGLAARPAQAGPVADQGAVADPGAVADAEADAALAERLAAAGALTVFEAETPPLALAPPLSREGALFAVVRRAEGAGERSVALAAYGAARSALAATPDAAAEDGAAPPAPAAGGRERRLALVEARFEPGQTRIEVEIDLPLELRNALTRLEIVGARSAGAVVVLDDSFRRRRVAIVSGQQSGRDQPLLSGAHYLRSALSDSAETRELTLRAALGLPELDETPRGGGVDLGPAGAPDAPAGPPPAWADVIVLSDIGRLDEATQEALVAWMRAGGRLIRFAGPRLAATAAEDQRLNRRLGVDQFPSAAQELLPVRLRGGGRALGGALSWSQPQPLARLAETGAFAGLEPTDEVTVARQVLAEPGPELSARVWASLQDGTPLVTARPVGAGQVVLFHVTANAEWSSLPLSGLFVQMMGRLVAYAPSVGAAAAVSEGGGEEALWRRVAAVRGDGSVAVSGDDDAAETLAVEAPVLGAALVEAGLRGADAAAPPGVYERETADGDVASRALSAVGRDEVFERADRVAAAAYRSLTDREEIELKPFLLAAAFVLLSIDVLAALFVAGRLRGGGRAPRPPRSPGRGRRAAAAALIAALVVGAGAAGPVGGGTAQAQEAASPSASADPSDVFVDPKESYAALETVFAHIRTGDPEVDRAAAAGLDGLSRVLTERTSIEPGEPAEVDLESDDISVYTMIYWPMTSRQAALSDRAIRQINQFLRTGGFLIVDTRDSHLTIGGRDGPNVAHLRRLLAPLDLPALEPMDDGHLLTRTFYIVDGAPGRWSGGRVWVQAGTGGDELSIENLSAGAVLNDGVSSILIGGADWASAWAVDDTGRPLYPMERNNEFAREDARRFGVNMAMYAYTGSYKSDQVHIDELLERLGN